jgi:hypothetical protein
MNRQSDIVEWLVNWWRITKTLQDKYLVVTNIREVRGGDRQWQLGFILCYYITLMQCVRLQFKEHCRASCSLTALLKGDLQNNTTKRSLKNFVYIYLTQHYDEQIINKNKVNNDLTTRQACNWEHNSDYRKTCCSYRTSPSRPKQRL